MTGKFGDSNREKEREASRERERDREKKQTERYRMRGRDGREREREKKEIKKEKNNNKIICGKILKKENWEERTKDEIHPQSSLQTTIFPSPPFFYAYNKCHLSNRG